MAFDVLMGFGLFDKDLREAEVDAYIARSNEFGVPLDSRAGFTKSDWILWAATLTADVEKRKKLLLQSPISFVVHPPAFPSRTGTKR